MHELEPYYNWRHLYTAEEDELSPFFERTYSEFEFTNRIYDHLIHPQWDDFGSHTLVMKILYADYDEGYVIIEMLGEWNDAINNDIMLFKRDIAEHLMDYGINKFIIIGENVLNFHSSDDSYYEEWFDEVEDGWITFVNFQEHVLREFTDNKLDYFINFGGDLDDMSWRNLSPPLVYSKVENLITKRLV